MYDKELTKKICDLTCSFDEININQTAINYDHECLFKKYYNIETIEKALKNHISKEWDDKFLANWCCLYNWIICGGFHDELKEERGNSIEEFIKNQISWDLDGLSFYDSQLDAEYDFE